MWEKEKNTYLTANNLIDVITEIYTEETLKILNENQIIDLFFKTQKQNSTTIASPTSEIKSLNKNFQKLESYVRVLKNVKVGRDIFVNQRQKSSGKSV